MTLKADYRSEDPKIKSEAVARFWSKVNEVEGCWVWTASRFDSRGGYGKFKLNGKNRRAHRVAWRIANGPIPDGVCVLHRCDNPACVNPSHLFLGTYADNNKDTCRKGHARLRCSAKLTAWEVIKIRESYIPGQTNMAAIARHFGINRTTVQRIILRKTWRHLP